MITETFFLPEIPRAARTQKFRDHGCGAWRAVRGGNRRRSRRMSHNISRAVRAQALAAGLRR